MRREIYHGLNILLILFVALFCCALQSVLFTSNYLHWIQIDLILIMILYLALQRPVLEGFILSIVIAHFSEINSGTPAFLALSCYLIVFAITNLTKELFLIESSFSTLILGFVGAITWKIVFVILAGYIGILENLWKPTLQFLIPSLISAAILINPFFSFLGKIDLLLKIKEQKEINT